MNLPLDVLYIKVMSAHILVCLFWFCWKLNNGYIQSVCGFLSAISYFRFSVSNQMFCIQVFTSILLKRLVQVAEAPTTTLSMLWAYMLALIGVCKWETKVTLTSLVQLQWECPFNFLISSASLIGS
jgi:hypothetical protein